MYKPILITGHAGTGKTTRLMELTRELAPTSVIDEHQRLLAMSFMHGARRRLEQKILGTGVPSRITTIDAVALSLLNRWRSSFGFSKPLSASSDDKDITQGLFEINLSFDRIRKDAATLLRSPTVGKIVGATFPLVVVDEFQDCLGAQLDFVISLASHTQLLLAADDFQLLSPSESGCPAVEWASSMKDEGKAVIEELVAPQRTKNRRLLDAAGGLRNNVRSRTVTVPVICCPRSPAAAWRIIEKLVCSSQPWKGQCMLISPTLDQFVSSTLKSCAEQLAKRRLSTIAWHVEKSQNSEIQSLMKGLGLGDPPAATQGWSLKKPNPSVLEKYVSDRAQVYCRLRGLESIPDTLVRTLAERTVSTRRAYGQSTPKRAVTTVHGAKNREVDYVFVLWNPNTVKRWSVEEQRRLLYNAVTRSIKDCMVLVLSDQSAAERDPVLSLLGPPQPAFAPRKKMPSKKRTSKRVT